MMNIDGNALVFWGFVLACIFMGYLFDLLKGNRKDQGVRILWHEHGRNRRGEPERSAPTPEERNMEERMMRLLDRMEQRISNLETIMLDRERERTGATERR